MEESCRKELLKKKPFSGNISFLAIWQNPGEEKIIPE